MTTNFNMAIGVVFQALDRGALKTSEKLAGGLRKIAAAADAVASAGKAGLGKRWENLQLQITAAGGRWNFANQKIQAGVEGITNTVMGAAQEGKRLFLDFEKGSRLVAAQAGLDTKQTQRMRLAVIQTGTATGEEFSSVQDVFRQLLSSGAGFEEAIKKIGERTKLMRTFGLTTDQLASFETAKKSTLILGEVFDEVLGKTRAETLTEGLARADKEMERLIDDTVASQKALGNVVIDMGALPEMMVKVKNSLSFKEVFKGNVQKATLSTMQMGMAMQKGLGLPFEKASAVASEFFEKMAEENQTMAGALAGIDEDLGPVTKGMSVALQSMEGGIRAVRAGAADPMQFMADMAKTVSQTRKSLEKDPAQFARFRTFFQKTFGPQMTEMVFDNWGQVGGLLEKDLPAAMKKAAGGAKKLQKEMLAASRNAQLERSIDAMKMRLGAIFVDLERKFMPGVLRLIGFLDKAITRLKPAFEAFGDWMDAVFGAEQDPAKIAKAADNLGNAVETSLGGVLKTIPWKSVGKWIAKGLWGAISSIFGSPQGVAIAVTGMAISSTVGRDVIMSVLGTGLKSMASQLLSSSASLGALQAAAGSAATQMLGKAGLVAGVGVVAYWLTRLAMENIKPFGKSLDDWYLQFVEGMVKMYAKAWRLIKGIFVKEDSLSYTAFQGDEKRFAPFVDAVKRFEEGTHSLKDLSYIAETTGGPGGEVLGAGETRGDLAKALEQTGKFTEKGALALLKSASMKAIDAKKEAEKSQDLTALLTAPKLAFSVPTAPGKPGALAPKVRPEMAQKAKTWAPTKEKPIVVVEPPQPMPRAPAAAVAYTPSPPSPMDSAFTSQVVDMLSQVKAAILAQAQKPMQVAVQVDVAEFKRAFRASVDREASALGTG